MTFQVGRFWEKVDKAGPVPAHRPELGPCWVWIGSRDSYGYGQVYRPQKGHAKAHRVSYEVTHGAIPSGLSVLHHCDNPRCCNPAHLFLGTHVDNMTDMVAKGRQGQHMKRSPLCKRGHDLTGANLYSRPGGQSRCRICFREYFREYQRETARRSDAREPSPA